MMNQKGQSLVEAVVALAVAIIVVSAMAVAAITALNNADFSKYQNLATQYAQQGIEIVRQQSQTDWNNFSSNQLGSWCLAQNSINLDSLPTGMTVCAPNIKLQQTNTNSFFVRQVTIAQTGPADLGCHGTVKATVSVSWTDGKCSSATDYCHNVILNSCFANLN